MRSPVRSWACSAALRGFDGIYLHAATRCIGERRARQARMNAGGVRARATRRLAAIRSPWSRALGDHGGHVQRLAVADQGYVEFLADARQSDGIAQLAIGLDGLAVDADDDVAGLDAGLFRRRTLR